MEQEPLCGRTDNDLAHINIGWLLNRERNGAGDRIRRHPSLVPSLFELRFHYRICRSFREVRPRHARRDDRHAQLVADLLAQALGDGAHGDLRASIDRHGRQDKISRCGSDVDEVPGTLRAEDRQCCRDAVENAFNVDIDHLFPILDAQIVEGGNWHNTGIIDENVKLTVPLTCQPDEVGEVVAPSHVCECISDFIAHIRDAGCQSLKAIRSARPKDDFRTALSEQKRSRLADSAACACDDDDLVFDSRHEVFLLVLYHNYFLSILSPPGAAEFLYFPDPLEGTETGYNRATISS